MNVKRPFIVIISLFMLISIPSLSEATVLDFGDLAIGEIVDNQYAGYDVIFAPGGMNYVLTPGNLLSLDTGNITAIFNPVEVHMVKVDYMNYAVNTDMSMQVFYTDGTDHTVMSSSMTGTLNHTSNKIIGQVTISGVGYGYTIDNFTFSNTVSSIPEESAVLLLVISVVPLAFAGRSRMIAFR